MRTKEPSQETLSSLIAIVGEGHAVRSPDDMAPYLREWRERYVGKAAVILKPGSTAEVSDILSVAHETGTAIVPQGGNSGLVGAQIPFETGHEVVVSLSRMDQIVNVDPIGNAMTVEAGAVLQNVQTAAEKANRLFPLSLAAEGSCQIGGNLATNAGGIHVVAYGTMRDLTLGLKVVLADGRIWDGHKSLRKDNSGYDLKDLFVGSEGTLGIITEAVLKLYPRPSHKVTILAGVEDLRKVASFYARVMDRIGGALTAFELLPRIGLEFSERHYGLKDPLSRSYPWYVLLELSGFGAEGPLRTETETLLAETLDSGDVADAVIAASLAQTHSLWQLRERMSEVQKFEGGSIKHDVSVPTNQIPAFIEQADVLIEEMVEGARPVPFGHFGDGNIHYNVSQPPQMDKQAFLDIWDDMNARVYALALSLGGSLSAEHGIGRMKREFLGRTKDPAALEMMRSIKTSLDPKGILNPGKVL